MGNKSSKIKQHQKRIKEENIELDLSVYNDKNNRNECNNKKDDLVASCSALHRISCCLKYYSILDIIHNINHHDMFNHFINDIYDRLLDDYIHLINHHSHQLSEINQTLVHKYQFVQCDISTCVFTLQHHAIQIDENNDKNESDTPLSFYKEKMNSLHFYLFHLQDSGLRITKTDTKENNENDIKENDAYFDAVFAKIKNMIFGKQHTVLEHSKPKFHLEISNINNIPTFTTNNTNNQTYMDELIQNISKRGVNNDETYKFKQIIFYEEYDSESIVDDIMSNIVDDGNISNYMNNEQFMHLVTNYINTTQMTSFSFNIGFRFYYWDYYKHLKQIHDEEHMSSNVNVHSGYDICELYVEQKYLSFKEEISNYRHLGVFGYNISIRKAINYQSANIVKQTTAADGRAFISKLHYGINKNTILAFQNLLALILYTDFTDVCTDFGSTFRKMDAMEALSSVKTRNREYWWMSKILRETVELFGQCGHQNPQHNIGLKGPFYTGMSRIKIIPEFNIRLCSPTSTSINIEVAIRFSGHYGMIIQLNNNNSPYIRGFNCSWLSNYPEENERLFFGGFFRIKIESIRIIKTQQNFGVFMRPLFYLDAMITAAIDIEDIEARPGDKKILSSLLKWKLKQKTKLKFNKYIYNTFDCFCQNKREISLDLHALSKANGKMVNLILDKNDLPRKQIFDIFENAKHIVIQSSDYNGWISYELPLLKLLSLLESISFEQVIVKTTRGLFEPDSWISSLWLSSSWRNIREKYTEKNFNISMKQVKLKCTKEDWLTIERAEKMNSEWFDFYHSFKHFVS